MKKTNLLGTMLATSLAVSTLAGCPAKTPGMVQQSNNTNQPVVQQPAPTQNAKPTGTVAPAKQQAGDTNSQDTAAAMAEEREMEDYGYLAEEDAMPTAKYSTLMVGAAPAGEGMVAITATGAEGKPTLRAGVKARLEAKARPEEIKQRTDLLKSAVKANLIKAEVRTRLDARRTKIKAKIKDRLEKLGDARQKIKGALAKAPWVKNEDGSFTKTITVDVTKTVNGKATTRKADLVRTISADGVLISFSADFSQTLPNGLSRSSTRTKTLQADGSYLVVFHSEIASDKFTRTADWTKTIAADGGVTGTGTIVWTMADGKTKTVTINLSGKEEEGVTAVAADPATGTTTEVTVPVEGEVTASVTDTTTKVEAEVEVDVDAGGDVVVEEIAAAAETTVSAGAEADAETKPASDEPAAEEGTADPSAIMLPGTDTTGMSDDELAAS